MPKGNRTKEHRRPTRNEMPTTPLCGGYVPDWYIKDLIPLYLQKTYTVKQIAEKLNRHEQAVINAVNNRLVKQYCDEKNREYLDNILKTSLERIQEASQLAVDTYIKIIESPTANDMNKIKACDAILKIGGLYKDNPVLNINNTMPVINIRTKLTEKSSIVKEVIQKPYEGEYATDSVESNDETTVIIKRGRGRPKKT